MKALTFWRGVLLAIVISVVGAVLHTALAKMFGSASSLRLIILGAALSYVLTLLTCGRYITDQSVIKCHTPTPSPAAAAKKRGPRNCWTQP